MLGAAGSDQVAHLKNLKTNMLVQPFPITPDPAFCICACLAVTCLGLSKGGFVGFGLVATPLLTLTIPPVNAVAILLPIMLVQDLISAWAYRRDFDRWNIAVMLPGAACGIGTAWLIAAFVPDSYLRLTVGLIGLVFVFNHLSRRRPAESKRRPAAFCGVLLGGVSGLTGTLANAAGPPFLIYVLPQQLEKLTLVGTMAIFFTVLNAIKVMPIFALGQFSTRNLATSIALLPLAVATNFFAISLVRKTPADLFYKIAYILMLFVSIALIWQGASPILRT
jgi:uncharacterized membrane protein YfcA